MPTDCKQWNGMQWKNQEIIALTKTGQYFIKQLTHKQWLKFTNSLPQSTRLHFLSTIIQVEVLLQGNFPVMAEIIRMETAKHFLRNPEIRPGPTSLKVMINQIYINGNIFYGHSFFPPLDTNELFLQCVCRTVTPERTVRTRSLLRC